MTDAERRSVEDFYAHRALVHISGLFHLEISL